MEKTLYLIVFLLAIIALGPLITIWSLNTLFPQLEIAYNLSTWAAIVWLGGVTFSRFKNDK